ncbi:NAD(P)H-hydrate dehydratase [Candidatus Latescibacterota bacterium]
MKLLTAKQMSDIDRLTIERGTPGIDLMRNAGKAVFDLIVEKILVSPEDRIVVLAEKGNNGGDGHRIAELLAKNGCAVELFLTGKKTDVRGDARTCMQDAETAGLPVKEILENCGLETVRRSIESADVIVDALFGTGLKGDIRGLPAFLINVINNSDATVVAVDVPSGVNASTGEVSKETIRADYTVTFGFFKVGHVFGPGKQFCGDISIADIGFNPEVTEASESFGCILSGSEAAELVPKRPYNAHKGTAGRVFVLTGSVGMTGASVLSSMAALRIGAGLVTAGCPASLNDILEVKLTEAMTLPLPEVRKKRCLSLRALGMVRKAAGKADIVAVGPGLGVYHETAELVRRFLGGYSERVVLDADGLNAFKGRADVLAESECEMVLTPHPGELAGIMDMTISDIVENPVKAAKEAAEATGKIVLLKGSPSVMVGPDGAVWINPTGNEGMATAGMGDVLTGVIAGLAAQGLTLFDAALLGAYIHGRAGDLAADIEGIHGLTAGDVLDLLPQAIIELKEM